MDLGGPLSPDTWRRVKRWIPCRGLGEMRMALQEVMAELAAPIVRIALELGLGS